MIKAGNGDTGVAGVGALARTVYTGAGILQGVAAAWPELKGR